MDDNSQDGTEELVAELSGRYPVRLVVRKDKRGLASAVIVGFPRRTGTSSASWTRICSIRPKSCPHCSEPYRVAQTRRSKSLRQGWRLRRVGLLRRIMSRGAGFLAHLFLPSTRGIADPMSGFFMFRPHVIGARHYFRWATRYCSRFS
jgi:dolichol-phosphate mannosyltransferase